MGQKHGVVRKKNCQSSLLLTNTFRRWQNNNYKEETFPNIFQCGTK